MEDIISAEGITTTLETDPERRSGNQKVLANICSENIVAPIEIYPSQWSGMKQVEESVDSIGESIEKWKEEWWKLQAIPSHVIVSTLSITGLNQGNNKKEIKLFLNKYKVALSPVINVTAVTLSTLYLFRKSFISFL